MPSCIKCGSRLRGRDGVCSQCGIAYGPRPATVRLTAEEASRLPWTVRYLWWLIPSEYLRVDGAWHKRSSNPP